MPLLPTKSKISQQKVQDLFMQIDALSQKANNRDNSASRQATIEMSVYHMALNSVYGTRSDSISQNSNQPSLKKMAIDYQKNLELRRLTRQDALTTPGSHLTVAVSKNKLISDNGVSVDIYLEPAGLQEFLNKDMPQDTVLSVPLPETLSQSQKDVLTSFLGTIEDYREFGGAVMYQASASCPDSIFKSIANTQSLLNELLASSPDDEPDDMPLILSSNQPGTMIPEVSAETALNLFHIFNTIGYFD